jgi:hypothetical protein
MGCLGIDDSRQTAFKVQQANSMLWVMENFLPD